MLPFYLYFRKGDNMANITPQGTLFLCKTPLEDDYKNQLTFNNVNAQLSYFNSKIIKSFNDYTYIRQSNQIKVYCPIDDIIDCNYLFYNNNGFTTKTYFCFIKNMEYVNENSTLISFETDCFQTWQFAIQYKKCFVEREHVNDDTVGINTVPENVELGEYTMYNIKTGYSHLSECHIVMGSNANPDNGNDVVGRIYSNIFSGIGYFAFYSINDLKNAISRLTALGKADAIQCLFLAPDELTDYDNLTWIQGDRCKYAEISEFTPTLSDYAVAKPLSFNDNYTPKNKKLLTYPYQYFILSNNCGESGVYKYEDFSDQICLFKIYGALTQGCSIRAIPYHYKNQNGTGLSNDTEVWQEGISAGKYPQCSWNTDNFLNWITQQGINNTLSEINGAIKIGASAFTANVQSLGSGISEINKALIEEYQHRIMPNTFNGNTNNGDVTYSEERLKFEAYPVQIKPEYARIIDEYFTMYGYKVNRLKIPNVTGRNNWNYVKTINCNFDGDIPQQDLNTIKNMFNNGITFWHNPLTFLDYSQNNNII